MVKVWLLCPSCKTPLQVDKTDDNSRMICPICSFASVVLQFPKAPLKKVACPVCKSVLSVVQKPGRVNCPNCRHSGDISDYPPPKPPADVTSAAAVRKQDAGDATVIVNTQASESRLSRPAVLVLKKGVCNPRMIVLTKGMNTIGRKSSGADCSIKLDSNDEFISRNHARIEFTIRADETFEYYLSDSGSKNGTFLNDKRIEKGEIVILRLKDKIRLGHTTFEFTLE